MERVPQCLRRVLRIVLGEGAWSVQAMAEARVCSIDHDPSHGVRHIFRWDRVGGG